MKMMRKKEIVATITTVLMMIFKVFIFGSVLTTYSILTMNWIGYIVVIVCGIAWVLGLQNIMMFYQVFGKKGD
jgi:hypothetical protein